MTPLSTKRFWEPAPETGEAPSTISHRRSRCAPVATCSQLLLGLVLSGALPASDQGAGQAQSPLSIHAFLTQGFAASDGFQIFGIPEEGTTDLRSLALQIRYELSHNDVFVLQFNHERTGRSSLAEERDDVAVDWAFYERRFGSDSALKIGRIPLPFGIYNETRDVGTILPFYRPPLTVYGEAGQTTVISQNIDGLLLSHVFPLSQWSVSAEVYAGEWSAFVRPQGTVIDERYDDAFGLQIWLNTPTPGFRFGAGYNQFQGQGLFSPVGLSADYESLLLSAEVPVGRFLLQGEYFEVSADFDYFGYYGLVGYKIRDDLRVYVQGEVAEFDLVVPFLGNLSLDFNEEWALGFNYWVQTNVLLKLEAHTSRGFAVEDVPIDPFGPPLDTDFAILSMAVSF